MTQSQARSSGQEPGLAETPDPLYWGYRDGEEGTAEEPVGDAENYFGPLGVLGESGGG